MQQALDGLRGSAAGPVVFLALQVLVAVSGAVPASLIGVAAGAAYGLAPGFGLAAGGTLLGAVLAFALSRSLFRPAVEAALWRRRLQGIDALVATRGWKFVFLLRLSPVMPFSVTSYLLGLSSIGFIDYLLGTLACLPALAGYVFIGTLTDAGLAAWASGGGNPVRFALLTVGGLATLLLIVTAARLVRQSGGLPDLRTGAPNA
ncbi:MAG: TVP38/TMEM64 family protein [Thiohalocapsa sp.]